MATTPRSQDPSKAKRQGGPRDRAQAPGCPPPLQLHPVCHLRAATAAGPGLVHTHQGQGTQPWSGLSSDLLPAHGVTARLVPCLHQGLWKARVCPCVADCNFGDQKIPASSNPSTSYVLILLLCRVVGGQVPLYSSPFNIFTC